MPVERISSRSSARTVLQGHFGAPGAGRLAVFLGGPLAGIGMGIIILLAAAPSFSRAAPPAVSENVSGLVVFALVLLPYSGISGAFAGLYGCRFRAGRCALLVSAGVAAVFLLPVAYVHGMALGPAGAVPAAVLIGAGTAQIGVALGTWVFFRRRVDASGEVRPFS